MYKEEKDQLKKYKQTYEQIDIPHDLIDERIRVGLHKGKTEQKQPFRKNWLLAVAILTIILVGFVSTKQIIDYIRDNKGLMSAIEHDYYEEMGISVKKEDIEFVVDGVIADEKGIVIFYTIHSDTKRENIDVKDVYFTDQEGKSIDLGFLSYGGDLFNKKKRKSFNGVLEAFYKSDNTLTDFNINIEVADRLNDGTFQNSDNQQLTIPLTIKKEISTSKVYELNEPVVIEGQKITFQSATVSPLRTAVHVKMDSDNTKTILQFEDLRIVNENGETWGKITDGLTATSLSDDDQTIYLQSNYFKEPKELYLELNQIQALDKDESKVIVDPLKEKIIKQPKGNLLKRFDVVNGDLVFEMDVEETDELTFFGFEDIYNKEGEVLSYSSIYFRQKETSIEVGVKLDDLEDLKDLILLELSHYPIWITGNERIPLN